MDSNQRPDRYERPALTNWAMDPPVRREENRTINFYSQDFFIMFITNFILFFTYFIIFF